MYWILLVMAFLFSIVIAVVVGGLVTPRKHTASRAIVLPNSPLEKVWDLIRSVANYPDWRDDIQSVTVAEQNGQTTWTETGRQGSISYIAAVSECPARFTARITDEDLAYCGEWQYVLSANNGGTRLIITEQGEVGNPVFRFFGAHFFGYTRTIDAYLRDLAMQLNEQAKPEPVSN
ncbi:MAG: SRPBCC family protein [Gemmatimonadaceae bacterium]